jgi:sugar/nucleoside kinase (ribokinase family)
MTPDELRSDCATRIEAAAQRATGLRALVGLDGFVDEIIHVVDKRDDARRFSRVPTIARFAERIAGAAGKSTNIELVTQLTKLGGNGPIMANALVEMGLRVSYVGALGYPNLHPVFQPFAARADVVTIGESGHTDALEFEDGKLMIGKTVQLNDVTWANIQARVGRESFEQRFLGSDLVAFVNWTMLPYMSDVWDALLAEVCPKAGARRTIFFDLADPEKRTPADITRALELIKRFERHFDVILGLNEKEANEVGKVLGLPIGRPERDALLTLATEIKKRVPVSSLLVHPTAWALTVGASGAAVVDGPYTEKPVITTGAGDHFNAGFCLGRLLGLPDAHSLLCGVSASGHYVRTGRSPTITDLAQLMRRWPSR